MKKRPSSKKKVPAKKAVSSKKKMATPKKKGASSKANSSGKMGTTSKKKANPRTSSSSSDEKKTVQRKKATPPLAKASEYVARVVNDLKKTPHRTGDDVRRVFAGERFPGCRNLPVHLATLDLGAIPCLSDDLRELGKIHVVYSNCESCDAWMLEGEDEATMAFRLDDEGRLVPANAESYPECCGNEGEVEQPPAVKGLELVPRGEDYTPRAYPVRVGGEPAWLQASDLWCVCPDCDQVMEYVAQVDAIHLPPGAGCGDQRLYVSACAKCRTVGISMQCT